MRVLVVGGTGYIGSHMVKLLAAEGMRVTVFDNLSSGHREAVGDAELVEGDRADRTSLTTLFRQRRFSAVMHFASSIQVGESIPEPAEYYRNSVSNILNVLDAMVAAGVRHCIFSSSAAIFGEPERVPITEEHPKAPTNPYGRTKWFVEQILEDYERAYGLQSICLRYFNAAGADRGGALDERHDPETHLIPLVLRAAAGRRPSVSPARLVADSTRIQAALGWKPRYPHLKSIVRHAWQRESRQAGD
ncbi:NAD-dependent epimerase/dehydratase family protein [Thiohalomonas denitrificans]|uniref:UDP-glucose 4-epimerase n=1 Tax=Thiohalomonas denitrificans TaxID=415747 RepID=A0A1G5QWD3_9GAMM|nr:NAD-dependent epimerase/dehydratase family protein [Thiohalomonas denitrificans]SCZ65898.1 UDP-glucose-4-epimerase GalE [Thiohalomonas denitrificans]